MKILITGATGMVGKKLVPKFIENGHQINILTRNIKKAQEIFNKYKNIHFYEWSDTATLPNVESLNGIDGVVNLIGENIGGKLWSKTQKEILYNSRVNATKNLIESIRQLKINSGVFVNASAIGIYPVNLDVALDENSEKANSFLGTLCQDWEEPLSNLPKSWRTVVLRTGVVLDKEDGALKKMLPPFYMGVGGILGDGKHMMSWIHIDDIVNLYYEAIINSQFNGVYNATSPQPVSNYQFTKALGKAINRPTLFPVPKFVLKTIFGEMSTIILDSQKVVSKRLEDQHFQFKLKNIDEAFNNIFEKN